MRKILLTTMIAGALVAPIANAQVSLGGGGGIGVNAGPVGVGASGRTDVAASTRATRLDKRIDADAQVRGNVVSETARTANGAVQAGADTAAEVGSTLRGTARAGAQAATNASAQAVESVNANANAAGNSALGAAADAGSATNAATSVTGRGQAAAGLDGNVQAATSAAAHTGVHKQETAQEPAKQDKDKPARSKQRREDHRR